MIKLQDSQIVQILPEYLSERAEVQALSFAVHRAVGRLVDYCKNVSVYSVIDTIPEYVLDLLAVELGTQYYDDTLNITAKRNLIRNTLTWYMGAGTPAAVEELVNTVFGTGEIQEWFQYGGEPYMFRVVTGADAKYESINEFEKLIEKVKNVRSHIDEIIFMRQNQVKIYFSAANITRISVGTGWEGINGNL